LEACGQNREEVKMPGRYSLWVLAAFSILVLVVLPHIISDNAINILYLLFLYISLAQSWNLLAGYAGLISLGHASFFGLGAYTTTIIANYWEIPLPAAIFCGGLITAGISFIVSKPLLRFGGIYFALGSLALSEILRIFMNNLNFTGGSSGISLISESGNSGPTLYYSILFLAIIATAIPLFFLRSKAGFGMRALRDNEDSARHMGVKVFRTRLYPFMISASIAGLAGGIHALKVTEVKPDSIFNIIWVFSMAGIVFIGGIGTIPGPIFGSFLILFISVLFADCQSWYLAITGVLLIAAVRFFPGGIWGKINLKGPSRNDYFWMGTN
jgi:branched-chain amino acid transport system permease protein